MDNSEAAVAPKVAAASSSSSTSSEWRGGAAPVTSGAHLSIWQSSITTPVSFGPLVKNIDTDVVIVGAGIAGMTTAYHLTRSGIDVVLVDGRQHIGGGETGRTSAHLSSHMDDGIVKLQKVHGKEKTRLIVESHAEAINMIETISNRHRIDCDFMRVDGFLIPRIPKSLNASQNTERDIDIEWKAMQECGVYADAHVVDRVPSIEGINTGKSIRFPMQGQFHPLKYLNGMAKLLTDTKIESSVGTGVEAKIGRCNIYCSTQIHKYEGGERAFVESKDGHRVNAKHVIMATNVPLHLISMIDSMSPHRSYVICASIPSSQPAALWWDDADPYHYVRLMKQNISGASGGEKDIIMIGGEDHVTGRDEGVSPEERYKRLETWARLRWPNMGPIECKWSGQVEEPYDNIAYIGHNPHDKPNVFIVTGDSGQGLTHGTIAGKLLSDLIMKQKNKYEGIYSPSRIQFKALPDYLQHNLVTQLEFGRYFSPSDISDIEELTKCSGAVIREGGALHAVYKDEQGKIHKCSAVCPHMKGIVKWNNDEQTWDCPVHGSRFTALGDVVNGPAKEGLARVPIHT